MQKRVIFSAAKEDAILKVRYCARLWALARSDEGMIMGLSVRDILILDYFDGKPVHTKAPAYQEKVLGPHANQRIRLLLEEGWIRYTRPQETVNMLPDKALADFLAHYGYSPEGSHAQLVRRVIENIPETDYAHAVPKLYIATMDGRREMNSHMAYILNARGNYGLTEGEIGEAQRTLAARREPCSAKSILLRAFQQKIEIFTMGGEWTRLRNLYFTMGNFYVRQDENHTALTMLYLVFLLDMSGMENRNRLVTYEELFPTQKGIILLMNQLRKELGMSEMAVKTDFLSSIARMGPRLPFSYFSPQVMARILVERLRGFDFDRTRYISEANTPDASSKAYHYRSVPFSPPEGRGEGRDNSSPQDSFGIRRRHTPPVPPVMRVSGFATKPFVPSPGARKKLKKRPEAHKKTAVKGKEKKKNWIARLLGR